MIKILLLLLEFHASNEPLYLAEYRQDFALSSLILDAGYTEGYKKKQIIKLMDQDLTFYKIL